ncbi:hypothetical protein EJB05_54115, partial [Eragrostis curvula]
MERKKRARRFPSCTSDGLAIEPLPFILAGNVTDSDEEVPGKKPVEPEEGWRLRGAKISWEEQEMARRHMELDRKKNTSKNYTCTLAACLTNLPVIF